jgi:DNA-binding NarL/FixJ family response regulator
MEKTLILMNEENRILRTSISEMLGGQKDMRIVDACSSVEHIPERMEKHTVNLVLLGIGTTIKKTLHTVKVLKKQFPHIGIVIMDMIPRQQEVMEFVQAGVSGFIMKDATSKEFIATIRSIVCERKVLPSKLMASLFSQIADADQMRNTVSDIDRTLRMTHREHQVIALIVEGCANKQIAYRLNLSIFTVKSHVHNILKKLDLKTRVQIATTVHRSDTP